MNNEEEWVTAKELAARLNCSQSSISKKATAGCFPDGSVWKMGNLKRYDVNAIMREGKNNFKKYKQSPLVVARGGRIA